MQLLSLINSNIPLGFFPPFSRTSGSKSLAVGKIYIFLPPQGLTSSHGHYCLRTTCQSVRTDGNGFEVDCLAHGEEDAVFIE